MVCYLCHREVESNLFLLNRTILPPHPYWFGCLLCCRWNAARQWASFTFTLTRCGPCSPYWGAPEKSKVGPPLVLLFRLMWLSMGNIGLEVKWTVGWTRTKPDFSIQGKVALLHLLLTCPFQFIAAGLSDTKQFNPCAHTHIHSAA